MAEMTLDDAIRHIETEYGNVLAYASRHDWVAGEPLTVNEWATAHWLVREVRALTRERNALREIAEGMR